MSYYTISFAATEQILRAIALHAATAQWDEDVLAVAERYYQWLQGR